MKSTKRDSKQNRFISPRRILSGPRAKEYRRQLVLQSYKPSKSAFYKTSKYPLDISGCFLEDGHLAKLHEEYRIIASIEKKSLFHFLSCLHLCGFRIYNTAGEAQNAANRNHLRKYFEQNFNPAFRGESELQEFIDFYASFGKGRRNYKGKNDLREKLDKRYKNIFSSIQDEKKTPLFEVLKECATIISQEEIYKQKYAEQRIAAFDAAWQKMNPESRKKYRPLGSINLESLSPEGAAIVFNSPAQKYGLSKKILQNIFDNKDSEFTMNILVSKIGMILNGERKNFKNNDYKLTITGGKNHAGLSWLFNKGIGIFVTKDVKELIEMFDGIPQEEKWCIKKLKEMAITLQEHSGRNFADYRTLFGGQIDSWISNYLKRLDEISKDIKLIDDWQGLQWENISTCLKEEYAEDIIERVQEDFVGTTGIPIQELKKITENLKEKEAKKIGGKTLPVLQGKADRCADKDDIESVEKFNVLLHESEGLYNQFINVVEQNIDKVSEKKNVKKIIPPWLKNKTSKKSQSESEDSEAGEADYSTKKLNLYRGARIVDDLQQELDQQEKRLEKIISARADFFDMLSKKYGLTPLKAVENLSQKHRGNSERNPAKYADVHLEEIAFRQLINRIGGSFRYGDDELIKSGHKMFTEHNIFQKKGDCNTYFYNNQGFLYKSPFATSKNKPYKLDRKWQEFSLAQRQQKANFRHFFGAVENFIKSQLKEKPYEKSTHYLYNTYNNFLLNGLGEDIQKGVATTLIRSLRSLEDLRIPLFWENIVTRDAKVSQPLFIKLFNLYQSNIAGLLAITSPTRYFIRYRFQLIKDKSLYYVPRHQMHPARKKAYWKIPDRFLKNSRPLASGLKKLEELGYMDDKNLVDIARAKHFVFFS